MKHRSISAVFMVIIVNALFVLYKAHDEGGHACKMELVNLDRLEVIEGSFDYVCKLWQRGQCDSKYLLSWS
jgi:hypothetical protein